MLGKEKIRKEILAKRKEMPLEYINEELKKIEEKLFSMNAYIHATCIYVYMSFCGEVPTNNIIKRSLELGKRVAIPKITNEEMKFYYIKGEKDIAKGYCGIEEPTVCEIAEETKALMIVPGLAFDREKHRIGYGKGFYDKYLNKNKISGKIALAFDFQIYKEIPFCEQDVLMDVIITPKEMI